VHFAELNEVLTAEKQIIEKGALKMKNLARGSVLLGLIALIGTLFLFQPTAHAVTIAIDSQENNKQLLNEKANFNNDIFQNTDNQSINFSNDTIDNAKSGNKKFFEGQAFRATAYCLKGRTASGSSVRRGIVAADRRILPLGTKVNISAGAYSGIYVVADTGGAIKGRILDIWVPSCSEATRFGRRSIKVSVVK
jgi:3D (Asp-Asp-Asp) domain-containing protein